MAPNLPEYNIGYRLKTIKWSLFFLIQTIANFRQLPSLKTKFDLFVEILKLFYLRKWKVDFESSETLCLGLNSDLRCNFGYGFKFSYFQGMLCKFEEAK